MAALTKGLVGGDFLLHEHSPLVCRESKLIANATGVSITLKAGYPMDDNVPCMDGDEASCDGLLMQEVTIPDGESIKCAVLARGPAVINQDALPTADHDDDDFTMATIYTALDGLDIIVRNVESDTQESQTT